jgi:hypothetical protein
MGHAGLRHAGDASPRRRTFGSGTDWPVWDRLFREQVRPMLAAPDQVLLSELRGP